jgi:AraC-like DNA-binding protein
MEDTSAQIATKKMKDYIHLHIHEPIRLKQLAQVSGYSMYHASHLFKQETGFAPFEYIRKQRLIASAYVLRTQSKRVIDIAFDYQFASHEGYTRAFSKAFGINPKRYARFPQSKDWLIPYQTIHHNPMEAQQMTQKTAIIFTQIVERPKRKLILKRGIAAEDYFTYCEEVGCGDTQQASPWEILTQIKEALNEPAGCWLPKHMIKEGTSEYVHAVEVPYDYAGGIPEGFDIIDLEPCKMLVFQGEPYDDEHYDEAIAALWERIEKFNPEVYGYAYDFDVAPRMQLEPQGWRGYIELYPIRMKT